MQKRDFETYQKRLQDFKILAKFSETHVFEVPFATPSSVCTVVNWCSHCAAKSAY